MKHKLSTKKINMLIKDERQATKEYKHLGLLNLSKDEHKHKLFLERLKAKR